MQISVRQEDTLWKYSVLFDIPFQLIIDANPSLVEGLQIGDLVNIPGYEWYQYEIKAGDTIWKIAKDNHITTALLLQSNPTVETGQLQIGSYIMLPKRAISRVIHDPDHYTFERMQQDLNKLMEIYPFITLQSIGTSVMGKPIIEVQIGKGPTSIQMNGSMHANEWITTPAIMAYLNDYLLAVTNSEALNGIASFPLYVQHTLSIVPMVNPDGVNLVLDGLPMQEPYRSEVYKINDYSTDFSGWKANIRGVDLNKQFPALWERDAVKGPQSPAPRDFSGTAPLTEPEAIAMVKLAEDRHFDILIAFHTQGQEIYWGFEGYEPPESEVIVTRMAQASGYEAIQNVNSTAGYKDWFIMNFRKPGFTVELGLGENPLPIEQFPIIAEATKVIILASMKN